MQQLGTRPKWLWKIALRLLISGVCWFVLFFPFAVAQEPKHPPLISYRVKLPGAAPERSARWLGRGGCCMRWADNTPQRCKQDTPPSRSHPASAPAACCFVMACHDMGVSSQIGEPIVLFSSPFPKSEKGLLSRNQTSSSSDHKQPLSLFSAFPLTSITELQSKSHSLGPSDMPTRDKPVRSLRGCSSRRWVAVGSTP